MIHNDSIKLAKLFVVARGAASLATLKDSYPAGRIEVLAGDLGESGIGAAAVRKAIEVFGSGIGKKVVCDCEADAAGAAGEEDHW